MRILRACAFTCVLVLAVFPVWAHNEIKVCVEHANAREAASSQADIVRVLKRGEVYPVVEDVPYWYGISLGPGQYRVGTKGAEHASFELDKEFGLSGVDLALCFFHVEEGSAIYFGKFLDFC